MLGSINAASRLWNTYRQQRFCALLCLPDSYGCFAFEPVAALPEKSLVKSCEIDRGIHVCEFYRKEGDICVVAYV